MKFTGVTPQPGETRRYVTNPAYDDGTYIVTRELSGRWSAWVIENLRDPAAAFCGWRGITRNEKTMAAARTACEAHFADVTTWLYANFN